MGFAYDTWGASWANSWNGSWGQGAAPPPAVVVRQPNSLGGKPEKFTGKHLRDEDKQYGTKYDGLDHIEEIKVRYDAIFGLARDADQTQEIAEIVAPYASEAGTFSRLPAGEAIDFLALQQDLLLLGRLDRILTEIETVNRVAQEEEELFLLAATVLIM